MGRTAAAQPGTLRCAALALRLSAERAGSVATLVDSVAVLVDAAPPAEHGTPTLLALPEHTGLLAMLVGERGEQARSRWREGGSTREILFALAGGYGDALGAVARRFPEVDSAGQLLHLACTDTVVRTLVEGFGGLAAERGVWLAVSAALPRWRWVDPGAGGDPTDLELAAAVAGPQHDGHHPIAVPTSAGVRNRQLLLSPEGRVVAVHDKVALVPMEADGEGGLGLEPGTLAELAVAELPIGRVATVISKDAWMPDVNARLDQLGAQVLVQPEAFDRWGTPDHDPTTGRHDLWPPDKFQRGGWWMVQRHPSFRVNLAPMLRGTLGELAFDGQPLVAVPSPAGQPGLGLHGQPPDTGWAAVGTWSRDGRDDIAVATVTVPQRRPAAEPVPRHRGVSDSVEVEGGAPGDGAAAVQLVPDAVAGDAGAWLAWVACDASGRQQLRVAAGDGRDWGRSRALSPDPVPAAAPGGDPVSARRWRPRLVVDRQGALCLHLGFPAGSWDVFAVRVGDELPAAVRVDDADRDRGVLRERLHDAPVVVRHGDDLVAVWSDLRWPWVFPQVRTARSQDGGLHWSASARVDGRSCHGRSDPRGGRSPEETGGQTSPSIAVCDAGVLVAWQERDARGVTGLRTAWLEQGGGVRQPVARAAMPGVELGDRVARPVLAATGRTLWLVWEVWHLDGGASLWATVSADAGRHWSTPQPLDPTRPPGTTQRCAQLVAADGGAVAIFEDDRVGRGHILAVRLSPTGGTVGVSPPRRLDDAPAGSHARAPTAARHDDRVVVVWQDTRTGADRLRSAQLVL